MDTTSILSWLQNLIGTKQQNQSTQFNQGLGLQTTQTANQNTQAQAQLAAQVQAQQAAEQIAKQQQALAQQAQDQGNALAVGQQGLDSRNTQGASLSSQIPWLQYMQTFKSKYDPTSPNYGYGQKVAGITIPNTNSAYANSEYNAPITRTRA